MRPPARSEALKSERRRTGNGNRAVGWDARRMTKVVTVGRDRHLGDEGAVDAQPTANRWPLASGSIPPVPAKKQQKEECSEQTACERASE